MIASTLRALRRNAFRVPAIVAKHAPVPPVIRQRDGAVRARQPFATGTAHHEARETPPIQQQQALLPLSEPLLNLLDEFARKGRLRFRFEKLLAHVDDFNARQRPLRDALRHRQTNILTGFGVIAAFDTRRCRAKHRDGARFLGADQRDIAAVITRRLLLLVTAVVFFVDDNEAQLLNGRKDSRSSADNDARRAALDAAPLLGSFGIAERRVQDRHLISKTLKELAGDSGR